MSSAMACLKIFFTALVVQIISVESQINYFGVGYSPYVRSNGALWDSYTLDEIKQMLKIILKNHNAVSTYGMGVENYNTKKPWDKTNSNCLIARGAAQINRDRRSVVLSVSQGIHQNADQSVQSREIDNAFSAAADANGIWKGTVWGLTFTNEYIKPDGSGNNGQKVLDMIRKNKARAHGMGLKVGTRVHICDQIYRGPNQQVLKDIVRESDFIMCNLYPASRANNADVAVKQISDAYYSFRDGFWKVNKNIEVIIGETGWASQGETFNNLQNTVENMKNFWLKMKEWSTKNKVKVHMFEAFDEPWKGGKSGEKHFGWWKRVPDNSAYYIEKSTGQRVQ